MPEQLLIPKEEGSVVDYFDPGALKAAVAEERMRMERALSDQYPALMQIRLVAQRFVNVERYHQQLAPYRVLQEL